MKHDVTSFLSESYVEKTPTDILIESKQKLIFEIQQDQYKEEMKKFFPTIFNMVASEFQNIIPLLAPKNPSEKAILNKYIKGVDFDVRMNYSPTRNAYTYPWMASGIMATSTVIPLLGPLIYFINGFGRVFTEKQFLEPKVTGNTVSFPKAHGLKIMAFQTKGLLSDLSERQRVAVMLHEMGHWYHAKSALVGGLISTGSNVMKQLTKSGIVIFPPLAFAVFIAYNLVNRYAEKSADDFAKICGFGEDAAQALDRIMLRPRTDVLWLNKINDWIIKIFMEIQNVMDKVVPFLFNYPSANKRIEYLRDHKYLTADMKLEELELIEQLLIEGKIQETAFKLLKKPLNKMDEVVGKNIKAIFPIK